MYKIAICDDEPAICNMIQNVIIDHYEKTDKKIETSVFYSGEKLIESLNKGHTCDLLFLDIELYKISGLVVGEKIRKEYNLESMHIVFISAKTKYHHEVFKSDKLVMSDGRSIPISRTQKYKIHKIQNLLQRRI